MIRPAPANSAPRKKPQNTATQTKPAPAKPAPTKPAPQVRTDRPKPTQRPPQRAPRTATRPSRIPGVVVRGSWNCQIRTHTLIGKFARKGYRLRFGNLQIGFSDRFYQSRVKYRIRSRRSDTGWLTAAEWGSYTTNGPAILFNTQGAHPALDPNKSRKYSALVHPIAKSNGRMISIETDANGDQIYARCAKNR